MIRATKQIQSRRGNTLVVLTIGQTQAFVNGIPQTLSQPAAEYAGTTLVPLRFVAESFGADVAWLPSTHTVEINTVDQHLSQLPPPPLGPNGTVTGTLTGIFQNTTTPQITLRVNGENTAIPVDQSTIVLVQNGDSPAVQSDFNALKLGDEVRVTEESEGSTATAIRVRYGELVGTMKSVERLPDGTSIITLDDGQSRQVARDAFIEMAGQRIGLHEILPGERITIRTNSDNQIAYEIDVHTQGGNTNTVQSPSGPLTISSFEIDTNHPLKAGDLIHATLRGTPGQLAFFTVPGVQNIVRMMETRPGTYEGTLQVNSVANIKNASVFGQIKSSVNGGGTSPIIQAAQTVTIINKPPVISDLTPTPGSNNSSNRPRIYAVTDDPNGTGIDAQTTTLFLDDRNVTTSAIITSNFVTYQPDAPLPPGEHRITVSTKDQVGNPATRSWKFLVSGDQNFVTHFSSNLDDTNPTLSSGQPLNVTLAAQPGGHASFSVGNVARDIPMNETAPGSYSGRFVPSDGSSVQSAPVVAKFIAPDGSVVTAPLNTPITIAAGPPRRPKVSSPIEDEAVGDTVTISGRAAPGATVNISIDFKAKALGGLFGVSGKAGDTSARADANGNWQTAPLQLASPGPLVSLKDTTYTLTAVSVDSSGQASPETMVEFRHG